MRGGLQFVAALMASMLLAGHLAIAADKSSQNLAEELVEAMGADRRASREMHSLAEVRFRNGIIKLEQRECIRQVGREEFTERLASLVKRMLKPEEMRDAIAYFNSAVGKRHLEAIEQKSNVTAQDWPQRRAFLDTSAGYLLVTRGLITNSFEANNVVNRAVRARFSECDR